MRLHLVGGFLGSGKTTAILQAAEILSGRGKQVGIVTNEQGKHLVDTGLYRSRALPALEVTGGCICCHLDDFNERVDELIGVYHPDVIFAESVGSCADLVATVIKPLLELRADFDQPTSLSVFSDARLFYRYLTGLEMPFSEGVVYIYEKQLEEAELVVINKIDLLDAEKIDEVLDLAGGRFPGKAFLVQNSLERPQVAKWLELLESPESPQPRVSLNIDYDRYASGEKRFSWVDRQIKITLSDQTSKPSLTDCIMKICREFFDRGLHIAHLKFLLSSGSESAKFSLTALDDLDSRFSGFQQIVQKMDGRDYMLWINAMLEEPLEKVEKTLDGIVNGELNKKGVEFCLLSGFTRVPGYPKPTMRIGN